VKTTLLSTALPHPDAGSGASMTLALIASALAQRGQETSLCPVIYPEYVTPDGADHEQQLERVMALGLPVEPVISDAWRPLPAPKLHRRVAQTWRRDPEGLYPTLRDAPAVRRAIEQLAPDAVLVYGFEALAASREVAAPRFAAMSDPPHIARREQALRRWRSSPRQLPTAREAVGLRALLRSQARLSVELLHGCQAVGAFAHHHAEWLRGRGIPCRYYRTPIADPGPSSPARTARPGMPPQLLLVGHLRGTATLDGLQVFQGMLPILERELGPEGFEVRIVGGYNPPRELAGLQQHPSVTFAGFVDDVDREFRQADVVVVPVSIKLGVRVRILTAFSFGRAVVAHAANALGIPEAVHGENCLLGRNAQELAQQVALAVREPQLRSRLGDGARATYERFFAPAVAGAPLAEAVSSIAVRAHEPARMTPTGATGGDEATAG
jgi:glycosyltransferase involved in cell wall biosynthesis